MSFTDDAWAATADIRAAIEALPFLADLAAGTLERDLFTGYLAQDTFYLDQYGRVLAAAGSQAPTVPDALFWVTSAQNAFAVEQQLHGAHVADLTRHTPSATTVAYTSYLQAQAAAGSYPVLAAALLPCFWLYADTGDRLLAAVGDTTGHAYGDWIATYADPSFAQSTARARSIVDAAADDAGPATRARMLDAYTTASRYEWMFWDAAHTRQAWPV